MEGSLTLDRSVADPGKGPGGPSLFLDQTEARGAKKNLFSETRPPLISGSG